MENIVLESAKKINSKRPLLIVLLMIMGIAAGGTIFVFTKKNVMQEKIVYRKVLPVKPQNGELIGKIVYLEGKVYSQKFSGDLFRRIGPQRMVLSGEIFVIEEEGAMGIQMTPYFYILAQDKTRFKIEVSASGQVGLYLMRGKVFINSVETPVLRCQVITPQGICEARGAKFLVDLEKEAAQDSRLSILVAEGEVRLALPSDKKLPVPVRFKMILEQGQHRSFRASSQEWIVFQEFDVTMQKALETELKITEVEKEKEVDSLRAFFSLRKPWDVKTADRAYQNAILLLERKRFQESLNQFQSFVARYPQHPLVENAYYFLGLIYFENLKHYTQAIGIWKIYLEKYPNGQWEEEVHLHIGEAYHLGKQYRAATEWLERFLKEPPAGANHPESVIRLAKLYLEELKDYSQAAFWYKNYLSLFANGEHREEVLYGLSRCYLQQGRTDSVRWVLGQMTENFPNGVLTGQLRKEYP